MHRNRYHRLATLAFLVAALAGVSATAFATPFPNGAVVNTRIFNDCPVSILNVVNAYPAHIRFDEDQLICFGFANLHNWSFSADGGLTAMALNNGDAFRFGATLVLQGNNPNGGEAGLRVSPWWAQETEGRLNVRIHDGEIAAFGGVLPFYSFTGSHGVHYAAGEPIQLEITYDPQGNSVGAKGLIQYKIVYQGIPYTSPPLEFNNCTPGEEIHGCYGIMDDARAGGYAQHRLSNGDPNSRVSSDFLNIYFEPLVPPVGTQPSTWGKIKASYR